MIAIVMGVTGTGKTTVAKALVARTGWEFAEGDDYHSEANVAKMKAGVPLTDTDREPWLEALHQVLAGWVAAGKNGAMTCSALKETYRQTLSAGFPEGTVHFVLLQAPKEMLEERLEHRPGHFMNPALLDSQLATLEMPRDAIRVAVTGTPAEAVNAILAVLEPAAKN
jgi:gluconokinase